MCHKSDQTGVLYLEAIVVASEVRPCHLKLLYLILKPWDHIVCIQVVNFELLDDNKHEKIKHDESTDHHVGDEEERAVCWATVYTLDTSICLRLHGVLHHAVPILSSAHTDEKNHAVAEVWEIKVLIYDLIPFCDILE